MRGAGLPPTLAVGAQVTDVAVRMYIVEAGDAIPNTARVYIAITRGEAEAALDFPILYRNSKMDRPDGKIVWDVGWHGRVWVPPGHSVTLVYDSGSVSDEDEVTAEISVAYFVEYDPPGPSLPSTPAGG